MEKIIKYLTDDSQQRLNKLNKLNKLILPTIDLSKFNDFWNEKCDTSNSLKYSSSSFQASYKDDLGLKEQNYEKKCIERNNYKICLINSNEKKYINEIENVLCYLRKNHNKNIETEIYIYPTEDKRQLTNNLSSSGLTNHLNHIHITKIQDMIRLTIHEIIHLHEMEGDRNDIIVGWSIEKPLKLFEAITETIAILQYITYLSHKLYEKTNIKFETLRNYITCIEISYSVYLSVQILKNYGYTKDNYKTFFEKNKIKNSSKEYFGICCRNQKQPILLFEYIICRIILLLTNEFINSLDNTYQFKGNVEKYMTLEHIEKIKLFNFMDMYYDTEIDIDFSYSCLDLKIV